MPWLPFRGGVFASGAGCLRDNDVMVSKEVGKARVVGDVACMQVQEEAIWKERDRARARVSAKTTRPLSK